MQACKFLAIDSTFNVVKDGVYKQIVNQYVCWGGTFYCFQKGDYPGRESARLTGFQINSHAMICVCRPLGYVVL